MDKAFYVKTGTSAVLAIVTTMGLFFFMSVLISGGKDLNKSDDSENFIEFVRVRPQENLETRTRRLPEKPPEPKDPPKMAPMASSAPTPQQPNMAKMDVPKLDNPLALGDGPFVGGIGGGTGSNDKSLTPLVRVQPQMPRKAAMEGIEGWVRLRFDVTEDGSVDNVSVVNSKPPRVFDSSARQALLKWRYKPQVVDGKPIRMEGLEVQLDFNFDE
ncbi:MAG: energy transducer TonB [Bdellovibrionales bacterium]|nr:energy transducer TonB [Bdellovibrionales bacterium]